LHCARDTRSGTKGGRRCWAPPFHPQYVLPIDCVSWNSRCFRSCSRYDRTTSSGAVDRLEEIANMVSVLIMYLPALMRAHSYTQRNITLSYGYTSMPHGQASHWCVPNICEACQTSRHQCLCRLRPKISTRFVPVHNTAQRSKY